MISIRSVVNDRPGRSRLVMLTCDSLPVVVISSSTIPPGLSQLEVGSWCPGSDFGSIMVSLVHRRGERDETYPRTFSGNTPNSIEVAPSQKLKNDRILIDLFFQ